MDPRTETGPILNPPATADPLPQLDEARRRCPVRRAADGSWEVLGHPEALAVLRDHATFGNRVSTHHVAVPNGMDPPEHGPYREIVDSAFTPAAMAAFAPECERIAYAHVDAVLAAGGGDAAMELGEPFAAHVQTAFMGWPDDQGMELLTWQADNLRATSAGDRAATTAVAVAFERQVMARLEERRALGDDAPDDPTTRLLRARIAGEPLADEAIVSIVRNWTAGELGTIAASVGIVLHALAADAALLRRLWDEPDLAAATIDDALRARGPLAANRRVARADATLAGQRIVHGDRLRLLWPTIDRDERVFEAPDQVRPGRDPGPNLLYGAGIHVCPGAPLARLELRAVIARVVESGRPLALDTDDPPRFAAALRAGFERVMVRVG